MLHYPRQLPHAQASCPFPKEQDRAAAGRASSPQWPCGGETTKPNLAGRGSVAHPSLCLTTRAPDERGGTPQQVALMGWAPGVRRHRGLTIL